MALIPTSKHFGSASKMIWSMENISIYKRFQLDRAWLEVSGNSQWITRGLS